MKIKRILILLVIPFIFMLSSCWDLGSYESEKSYTDAFTVHIIGSDGKELKNGLKPKYTMEDFYNENSSDLKLPVDENGEVNFEFDEYKYLAFQPTNSEQSTKIGNIIFFVESTTNVSLVCKVSVIDHLPTSFKNLDNDLLKLTAFHEAVKGDDEHPPKLPEEVDLVFDSNNEPKHYIAVDSTKLEANEFSSVMFDRYDGHGDTLELTSSQYLLIEFFNNTDTGIEFTKETTIENAEELIKARRNNRCKIAFTMFIIEGK